jgi:hypothetical protein
MIPPRRPIPCRLQIEISSRIAFPTTHKMALTGRSNSHGFTWKSYVRHEAEDETKMNGSLRPDFSVWE